MQNSDSLNTSIDSEGSELANQTKSDESSSLKTDSENSSTSSKKERNQYKRDNEQQMC